MEFVKNNEDKMKLKLIILIFFTMILLSLNVKALTANETFDLTDTDTGDWIGCKNGQDKNKQ